MNANEQLEAAKQIVRAAFHMNPEGTCMLVASAIAGMRRLTIRHIRIGALFWPDKMEGYLSMHGGWGCNGYSYVNNSLALMEPEIDETDGGFSGHTWLEPEPGIVIDLMHDNERSERQTLGDDHKIVTWYIPRPKLERAVKKHWRMQMQAAIKLGRDRS